MNLRKTSILVLCGLMSYDSLAALPSARTSTLRLGATSTDSRSATASSTNRAATVSNYSKAATSQARASTSKALDSITSNADSIAELKTAMQEMQAQMNDALEQMNETLAEKDEVIEALSKEVTDYKSKYEEIKSAVEAMDDMMDDVAKADDLNAITTDLKAVQAKAEENKNNFKNYATTEDLKNLKVGTDESTVNKIVDGKLVDFAKVKDVQVIKTDLQTVQAKTEENKKNFENYATLKDLNNLELGTDESTVNKIIDSKLADFAPMESLESVLATLKANDQLSERYKEQIAELEAEMADIRVRADSHDKYEALIGDLKMRLDDIRGQLVAYVTRKELEMYAKMDDLKSVKVGADEDQVNKIIDSKLINLVKADDLKLYAKAEDLQNLKVGADEDQVNKIIDNKLTKYATTADLQKMSTGADEATVEKMIEDQIEVLARDIKDHEQQMKAIADTIGSITGESVNLNGISIYGHDYRSLKDLTYELGMVSAAHEARDQHLLGGTRSKMSDPSRLDTAKEQIAVLENALKELDANFKTWQEQEAERRKDGEIRIGELEEIRIEQERINDTIKEITEGSNSPFVKMPEMQKALDNLKASGSDDSASITELQKQIATLQTQMTSNMKLVDTLSYRVKTAEDYQAEIADIEKTISSLKALGSDNEAIINAINDLESQMAKLEEQSEDLSTNFRTMSSTLDNFGRRINTMPTVVDIKTAVDEAKTDLTQQFNTQINNKITGLTADLSSLTLTVGDLSSQLTTATKDLTLVSSKVEKVQIGLTDVQDELEETNSNLTNLSTTVKSSGGTVKATTTGSTSIKVSGY